MPNNNNINDNNHRHRRRRISIASYGRNLRGANVE